MFVTIGSTVLALALLYRKQYIPFAVVFVFTIVYFRFFRRTKASSSASSGAAGNENYTKLKRLFPEVSDSVLRQQLDKASSFEEAVTSLQQGTIQRSASVQSAQNSFAERKAEMYAKARQAYLEKHGGVVPKIVI
eukprot:m.19187 g.19187  ORF g.19187 m.19187 type:complete len:135 (-) comp7530_c0_seq1:241-645(-)